MESFSWKSCNIIIANLQIVRRAYPLTLWISREHASILNSTEYSFIACLRWWPMLDGRPDVRNQFITVETLTDDELVSLCSGGINSSGSNVLLYASQTFIRHYRLDSVDSCALGFRISVVPRPITLTSITLFSRNDENYHWFEKVDWCTHLLVDVCHKPMLCRQGDVCMFPVGNSLASSATECDWETWDRAIRLMFDLTVLECQPVRQGVLGPETALTLVKADSLIRNPSISATAGEMVSSDAEVWDMQDPEILDNQLCTSLVAHPQVLELVTKISLQYFVYHKQTALLNKTLRMLRIAHKCLYSWKARFKIQILAKSPFWPTSKMATKFDVFHVVFATSNTLKTYGFSDLSWTVVQLEWAKDVAKHEIDPVLLVEFKADTGIEHSNLQIDIPKKRCVQVCAIESHWNDIDISKFGLLQDSVVYMTPLLWFNLNVQPSKLVQEEAYLMLQKMTPGQYFKDGSVDRLAPRDPLFADEVHICLIHSSLQEKHRNFDNHLKNFFKLPRLFCQGDVFCLNANEETDCELDNEFSIHDSRYEDLIYFYVTDIKRKGNVQSLGFLVDHLHTSLYQEAAVQFYVPTSMQQYFSSSTLHPIWHSPLPFGFSNQTAQLAHIITPYLLSCQLWKTTFPSLCIYGPRACGKMLILSAMATQFNLHIYLVNCWELIGESSGATIARLRSVIQNATICAPCLLVLKNVHTICRDNDGVVGESRVVNALRETLSEFHANSDKYPLIFIGTTTDQSLLSPDLTSLFLHHFKFEAPTSDERVEIMRILTTDVNCGLQISLKEIAQKTSGFVLGDLCTLTSHTVSTAYQRISKLYDSDVLQLSLEEEEELCLSGIQLLPSDFDIAVGKLQAANSDAIGAPKIPNVKWDDVGGLEYAKEEILDTVQLPLQHPELMAAGLRRSGVLLYGPPGTGKTLLAKAVATECSLNFLSVKGPELINMYVGQSEENVRNVFQRARAAAPCIIFFDELDSLAPNRGGSGDSGGVMDRVVSQLLAEIDGLHRSVDVFIMGATNRPDLLDPALLRPGRFDKLLYVRISSDHPSQLKIMKALTKKFHLGNDVNLSNFVEACSMQLTGADFYALCSDALLRAMSRNIQELDKGNEVDSDIVVFQKDFMDALQNLIPSVSEDDLKRYSVMETTAKR